MLVKVKVEKEKELPLTELQKVALDFIPLEQVKKFRNYPHLVEKELVNEANEPEMENVIRDIFDALHERNPKKLLKVMQGDKKKIFYAYKKQLANKDKLTEKEARVLLLISKQEVSLFSLTLLRE